MILLRDIMLALLIGVPVALVVWMLWGLIF